MKILIDEKLKQQEKTRYWLSQETQVTYPNICNLCNGKTASVKFSVLEDICNVLNCEPGDILKKDDQH